MSTNLGLHALCTHIKIPITNIADGNNTIKLLLAYHPNNDESNVFIIYSADGPIIFTSNKEPLPKNSLKKATINNMIP